jgi:hypothetical protein
MNRPRLEIADVVRLAGDRFLRQFATSRQQRRVLRAIARCRTAELGGHVQHCCDSFGSVDRSFSVWPVVPRNMPLKMPRHRRLSA